MGLRDEAERIKNELIAAEKDEEQKSNAFFSQITDRIPNLLARWSRGMKITPPNFEVVELVYEEGRDDNAYWVGYPEIFYVTISFEVDRLEFKGTAHKEGPLLVSLRGGGHNVTTVRELGEALKLLEDEGRTNR